MSQIALKTLIETVADAAQTSRAPKHVYVLEAFARCIHSGQFLPGQRVPTEAELSERLPVSLGTVQKALSKLAERGLVVRNRKTGTYIADRRSQAPEARIYRFKDPKSGEVILPFTRVLNVCVDEVASQSLNLAGNKHVRVDRLVWTKEDPAAFNSVYVAYKFGRHLLDLPIEALHGSSFHRTLAERFDLPTLDLEHRFACQSLSDAACQQMDLAPQTIGCVWDIKSYSFNRESVLFQRFELPPGHRPIQIDEASTPLRVEARDQLAAKS